MSKKVIKLTESDLVNLVKRFLKEDTTSEEINPKNLKFGDRGNDVKILQQKLFNLGVLKTRSMKPTGYFGNLTKAALAKALGKITPKVINPKKSTDKKKTTTTVKDTSNGSYRYSPRIDAELNYIKQRQGVWDKLTGGKPFFIYDPKFNLIYLFDGNFNLIKNSQVVDGKDAQKYKKTFTQ
jgi:hypothetical protein